MKFMLVYRETADEFAKREGPEAKDYMGAWMAYMGAMSAAGVMVAGNGLLPPGTASFVSMANGAPHVQDGPYPDTKEQLGGYVILEVPDRDAAIQWAARSPSALLSPVEVRPVMPTMQP